MFYVSIVGFWFHRLGALQTGCLVIKAGYGCRGASSWRMPQLHSF